MASQLDLLRYLAKIDRKVGILFDKFHEELAKSGLSFEDLPKDKLFSFDRYPEAARKAQEAAKKLRTSLSSLIIGGVRGVVTMAFLQQKEAFGDKTRYTPKVLNDFRERTVQSFIDNRLDTKEGLNLSTCVWNYAEQSKAEFELGLSQVLEDGIRKGESAEEIGRKVRHKLNDPDMMWRRYHVKEIKSDGTKVDKVEWRKRVIDEDGKVYFVKQPLDHPGVGVYRSARKNAKRMAANEINMAHKYADIVRYQNEPFILGFHIGLSGHRSDVVENFHDMCDDLVGDYPKWFYWALWHVNCKCVITAILCSKEEMRKIQSLPEAEYRAYRSPNLIKDMPDCYDNYMALNEDRIARSVDRGTQPYWIRDNYVDGDPSKGFVDHSTPIVEAIPEKTPEELSLEEDAKKYSEAQRENFEDLERGLGKKRGTSMTYDEANYGKENPRYPERGQFRVNCQTCTVAHELRRRGFNVAAKGRTDGFNQLTHNGKEFSWRYRFLNPDGSKPEPVWSKDWGEKKGYKLMNRARLDEYFKDAITADGGRYEIYCHWKDSEAAHVFCAEKNKDGILFFDPQSGKGGKAIEHYFDSAMPSKFYVLRIDDKIINPEMMKAFDAADGRVKVMKTKAERLAEITEIAKKRHEARDNRLILAKWHTRKVIALSKEFPSLSSSGEYLSKNLYSQTDSKALEARLRDFAREVAIEKSLTPKELYLSELRKTFTQEEIEAALSNSKRTMDKYSHLDIAGKIDKFRFEADWIRNNRSFSTKEVVAKIYEREANRLERTLEAQKLVSRATDATKELKDLYGISMPIVKGEEDMLSIKRLKHQLAEADAIRNKFTEVKKVVDFASTSRSRPLKALVEELQEKIRTEGVGADISALLKKTKDRIDQINRDRAWYNKTTGKGIVAESAGEIAKRLGDKYPKTLQHLQDTINKNKGKFVKQLMKDEGISQSAAEAKAEEWIEEMRNAFSKYDYGMRIDPRFLKNSYEKHFKNLVETGRSGGSSYVPQRKHNEKTWFSMPDDIQPEEYTKYGCLLDTDILKGLSDTSASQYGSAYVRFKKDKVLCTWTWHDSLDTMSNGSSTTPVNGFPTLTTDPKPESFGLGWTHLSSKPDASGTVEELFYSMRSRYVELQYHGLLTFDAVQSIAFNSVSEMNVMGEKYLKEIITKKIPIYCLDGGKLKEAYITSQGTVGLH